MGDATMMRFKLCLAAMLAATGIGSSAHAGEVRGVVELFTSQGCSSCPPADRAFQAATGGSILGLAWHVDYWDYLGWRDTFSSAQATARQRAYANGAGVGGVYTPEIVINGKRAVRSGAIGSAVGGSLPVRVSIKSSGKGLVVEAGEGRGSAKLVLVKFYASRTVAIQRGENAGRSVTYRHPVISARTIGSWNGRAIKQELPAGACVPGGCAVLLQRGGAGEILGAATL
jgi:hypothetical protein